MARKSNQTYYVKITRGNCDINTPIYCTLSFYNRIKSGYGTFNFVGTASNSGGGFICSHFRFSNKYQNTSWCCRKKHYNIK